MSDQAEMIAWTRPMLERFKKTFKQAETNGADSFMFDGKEFVTLYAKYLIEYLETKLPHELGHPNASN